MIPNLTRIFLPFPQHIVRGKFLYLMTNHFLRKAPMPHCKPLFA